MSRQTRLITADEFLEWPDQPGCRQELIRGEVVTMSLPGGRHGKVAGKILQRLGNHVEAAELGDTSTETGFLVERDPDTVRGADVGFVRSERLATITKPEKPIPFAPDLAVEVRSPNDRDDDVEEKIQLGHRAGALMVWTVDPETRIVTIHPPGIEPVTLTEDETIRGDDVIPGFECRVGDFFR
jgi:Uma2 family endonuclease